MYDFEDVRRDDRREFVGMHAKLAVPDFHCGVLDLGGEGDTGIVEQNIKPSVRRHHRVTTWAQFCSDVTSRCR